ncbi:hypothetical protein ACIP2X_06100 [Streptomyces sp. NPDC089424]|uniref:hypothetical protein n=1 Tax=Streptomyces sp. NPDC089424 TaxID=3365917 RepID=UPI003824B212
MPPTSPPPGPSGPPPESGRSPGTRAQPRRRAGTALLLVTPLVVAATIGWSLHRDDRGQDEPQDRAATLRTALPLQKLLNSSPETARQVHRAEQSLVATCMARHGFAYEPAPEPAAAGSEATGSVTSYFGIESVDPAGGRAAGTERQPVERNRGQAFDRALYGDPERRISARNKVVRVTRPATGCLAEAQTRLLGEDGRERDLALRLVLDQGERDAAASLAGDAAARAADRDWRRCMAEAGIQASDPRAFAQRLPKDKDLTGDPSVTADLDCKKQTRYLERGYGRLGALQRDWLTGHKEDAAAWKSLRAREAANAARVLRGAAHAAP